AFASFPFAEVFRRSKSILTFPVYLGAAAAVAFAWRRRREGGAPHVVLLLAVVATALMIAVALMTQGGFAGNLRYVALPAAMVCILAGVGWVWIARATHARRGRAAALAVVAAVAVLFVPYTIDDVRALDNGMERLRL